MFCWKANFKKPQSLPNRHYVFLKCIKKLVHLLNPFYPTIFVRDWNYLLICIRLQDRSVCNEDRPGNLPATHKTVISDSDSMDKFQLYLYHLHKACFKDIKSPWKCHLPKASQVLLSSCIGSWQGGCATCRQSPADAKESKLGYAPPKPDPIRKQC